MTLDDDDDDVAGALGTGAAGASLRPMAAAEASPQSSTHLLVQPEARSSEEFRVDRPYVSMGAEIHSGERVGRERTDSLADRLGPVLLVAVPLATLMRIFAGITLLFCEKYRLRARTAVVRLRPAEVPAGRHAQGHARVEPNMTTSRSRW
jgi:hypothetical protein